MLTRCRRYLKKKQQEHLFHLRHQFMSKANKMT